MPRIKSVFKDDPNSPAAWRAQIPSMVVTYIVSTFALGFATFNSLDVELVWLPATLVGVWLVLTSGFAWRLLWIRRNTHPIGSCPQCGYDLRATPEQCPECGKIQS